MMNLKQAGSNFSIRLWWKGAIGGSVKLASKRNVRYRAILFSAVSRQNAINFRD
jgi:hypothetical protein